MNIDLFDSLGTDVDIPWTKISDEKTNIDDDQAAFDYDVYRGK